MKNLHSAYFLYLLIGIILTLLAVINWLNTPILGLIFILILFLFFYVCIISFFQLNKLSKSELYSIYTLIIIWALHFLQVLVPETGFDALWYHLPVVKAVTEAGGLIYIPSLYQSVNPLFADLYFLTGFSIFGIIGAKIIAYIFAIFLTTATYSLSRLFLPRNLSMVVILFVSTFQVVAWQASSFYVDIAKAFFEISGLYFILLWQTKKKYNFKFHTMQLSALLFFSASLATKLFSIFLLPVFIFSFGFKHFFSKKIIQNIFLLFFVPTLYYFFAYQNTSNSFYSFELHVNKLDEISGAPNPVGLLINKIIQLPLSLIYFAQARDYVNPVLLLLFVPIFQQLKNIWKNEKIRILLIFSVFQWVLWWFIPPISTRYAVSGFITLFIVGFWTIKNFYLTSKKQESLFIGIMIVFATIALTPRIFVAHRSMQYILGNQTQKQYLEQFYDGWIDEKINAWYF